MSSLLILIILPLLLVFGVYHLALWGNFMGIRTRIFWRRTAMASAVSHVILSVGILSFFYFDYRASGVAAMGLPFDAYLFGGSLFWSLIAVFDTIAMILLLALFSSLDRFDIGVGFTIPLTVAILLVVGTLQWYWLGGGVGAAVQRLWSGLKGLDGRDRDG